MQVVRKCDDGRLRSWNGRGYSLNNTLFSWSGVSYNSYSTLQNNSILEMDNKFEEAIINLLLTNVRLSQSRIYHMISTKD